MNHAQELSQRVRAYAREHGHDPKMTAQVITEAQYRMFSSTAPLARCVAAACVELELRKARKNGNL